MSYESQIISRPWRKIRGDKPEQKLSKYVAAACASATEHWSTTHVATASAIAWLLQTQLASVLQMRERGLSSQNAYSMREQRGPYGEQPEFDAAASKHASTQGGGEA